MTRYLLFCSVLLFFIACKKNNNSPTPPPVTASGSFSVSVDTAIGSATPGNSGDTFLIHLKKPAGVAAVPVVLHIPVGGHPDQGKKINDSVWQDTINISQNGVAMVNVTTADGKTKAYGLAYEYIISDYWNNALGRLAPWTFTLSGNALYVGTENGLYYSTDNGVNFTNVPALSTAIASRLFGPGVKTVYVSGNTIMATVLAGGIFTSRDGGKSFSEREFTISTGTATGTIGINALFAQQDTLYFGTARGLFISRDGGGTYQQDTVGLTGNAAQDADGVWAVGGRVYLATQAGLAISLDGGNSFTLHTSGLGTIFNDNVIVCQAVCVQNGTIYVGTLAGLSISKDNGLTFKTVGVPNGMGGNQIYAVAVSGNTVCAATNGGISISTDGGENFINLASANGLANYWGTAVAISGSTIFAGCQDINGGNPVVPGGLSVITRRK